MKILKIFIIVLLVLGICTVAMAQFSSPGAFGMIAQYLKKIATNMIPASAGSYTIGSATRYWKTICLGGTSQSPILYYGTAGAGRPYRTIVLTPAAGVLPSSNAATLTKNNGTNYSYWTMDYSNSADSSAYWEFAVPASLDSTVTTAQVYVVWTASGGTVGHGVEFEVSSLGRTNDEVLDASLGTAVAIDDALIATGDVHITPAGALTHGWTGGDMAVLKVLRDVDGGTGSQLAASAKVLNIIIKWAANTETD